MREDRRVIGRSLMLLAGLVVGAVVTAGVVLVVAGTVRGDAPTTALEPPEYLDESAGDGLDHIYGGEFEFFVGGGVAVLDCNDDLLPDLYLAGGANDAGLYVNRSETGGALRFEHVPAALTDLSAVTGAYPIDVDSDAIVDLAVLRRGENVLLKGVGDCRFEPANEKWSVDGGDDWTVSFSALWEGDAALPTLAFGNYLEMDLETGDRECADHQLLRPGQPTSYADPIELSPGWCTLSILFSDWSGNGDRDLRMTNDRHYYTDGQEQLWRIEPKAMPTLYSEEEGWQPMQIWGMGIASHDLTDDGAPEIFLTSQGDNKLQTLSGGDGPVYEDIALESGVTAHRPFQGDVNQPSTAWHAEFGDVNNDGFVDLFVTKGNVDSMPEFAGEDPNNLLLGQPEGSFVEAAADAGLLDFAISRGGALTDLNLDGRLDVVVLERRESVKTWRNIGPTGNWLAVAVEQPSPNTMAVGAWIEVRLGNEVTKHEVTIGGGHAGGEQGPHHFGLGDAASAAVRITWPDGEKSPWHTVDANQVVLFDRESEAAATLFTPSG